MLIVDPPPGSITWIKVERPVFDLAGVLVSSLSLAVALCLLALFLGCLAGLAIIGYRRRHQGESGPLQLNLTSS